MKRLLLGLAIFLGASALAGCPVYSNPGDYRACGPNGPCFDCPSGSTPSDGTCIPWQCSSSSDCPSGYSCSAYSCVLVPDASGCSAGCPSGFICKLSGGQTQCVPSSGLNDAGRSGDAADASATDGSSEGASDARAEGSYASDASTASDALADASGVSDAFDAGDAPGSSDASDASAPAPCNARGDCTGSAKCIDGLCTPQGRLCSDTTQCAISGNSCVDGVCEPHCSASAPCPAGYACDFTRGVCNVNPDPCVGSGASSCQGGSTCVEGRCVAPCAAGDTSSACPAGQLCVHGGCIPDEAALFTCANDGQSGQLATTCSSADICLHHDCYAACDPDAGASACSDPAAACKPVTVTAGTYLVCATSSNLGSDCDPAAGRYCPGAVCIDGYCK
jgi:hypothetical protein